MIGLVIVLLVVIGISAAIAGTVYRKQEKAGNEPWAWTIGSFILSAIVMLLGAYAFIAYAFSFER